MGWLTVDVGYTEGVGCLSVRALLYSYSVIVIDKLPPPRTGQTMREAEYVGKWTCYYFFFFYATRVVPKDQFEKQDYYRRLIA